MSIAALAPLPLRHVLRGKVREVYEVDPTHLLLVATDRVSAFDVVLREAIPFKGAVLTQMTAWWLRRFESEVYHHMVSADVDDIVRRVPSLSIHRRSLVGRAMLCRRTEVFPIECVVRGYLAGSAWKEYSQHGTLAGESLPPGLRESERFETPIFSPATKAVAGHDENITPARVARDLGAEVAADLEQRSRRVYEMGRAIAAARGIIIADTKFEFGRDAAGRIVLIDEVLTPDSSRFWPVDQYAPGRPQPSFDKQPLRDYLDGERRAKRWNGDAPPPPLPSEVVRATSARYLDAFARITGGPLDTDGVDVSFAREGLPFIVAAAIIAAGSYGLAIGRRSWPLWLVAFALTLVALWVAYFFEHPERPGDRGDRLVISPADGRVVDIAEVDEPSFMGGKARRVSIFMNIFSVHVNRYPISGTVRYVHYNPGKFLNAASDKASLDNEQRSVGIERGTVRVLTRQIAGLIARRIVTYSKVGDIAEQGVRMGIIRFGSRVDVFLPLNASVRVTVGQSAEAGMTVVAELPTP